MEQNRDLREYFEQYEKSGREITVNSVQVVANAFWDIAKTARAYLSIGMALKFQNFMEEGLAALSKGLQLAEDYQDDQVQYDIYISIGDGRLVQAESTEEKDLKNTRLSESRVAYEKAISLRRTLPQDYKERDEATISASEAYGGFAIVALLEDKVDESLKLIKEAREDKVGIQDDQIERIMKHLDDAREWSKAIAFRQGGPTKLPLLARG